MKMWKTLFLLLVTGFLTACGGSEPTGDVKVYRHSENGSPTNLDPIQTSTIYANIITVNAYDTLYRYKYLARPFELAPNLATGLPEVSDDGLTYTFRIKQGVEFIDDEAFPGGIGREVVAEDFVYSIKRHFDPGNISQGSWLWDGKIEGMAEWAAAGADYDALLSGLQALDDYTIRIRLTRPFPQLTYTLAMGFSAFVPREAVEFYGPELSLHPVGSGPFKLVSFDTTKAVFEANSKYRQEPFDLEHESYDESLHAKLGLASLEGRSPPFVDRLEIDFINEASSRWASFTSGREIQYSTVPVEQVDTVVSSKDPVILKPEYAELYHYSSEPEAGFVYTMFNMADPVIGFSDEPGRDAMNHELRCAIRDAFSWEQRNVRIYAGMGLIFPGAIPPITGEFDPTLDRDSVTRNLERARQRLADAGWNEDNLPVLEWASTAGTRNREMFEQFRGNITEAGYPQEKVDIRTFANFGDFNAALKNRELMIYGMGWGLDYPDAENTMQLFYGPNSSPGSNSSNYEKPEFDALYERTAVMQSGTERTALYSQMNQMLIDDCVGMMSISRQTIEVWHKDVIGLPERNVLGGYWLRFVDVVSE
jgi:oligopeptide transport system substrate-binding protein